MEFYNSDDDTTMMNEPTTQPTQNSPTTQPTLDEMLKESQALLHNVQNEKIYKENLQKKIEKRMNLQYDLTQHDEDVHSVKGMPPAEIIPPGKHVTNEYDHWKEYHEHGYGLGAEWFMVDGGNSDTMSEFSLVSEIQVEDEHYLKEMAEKRRNNQLLLVARQIFRLFKKNHCLCVDADRLELKEMDDYWLVNHRSAAQLMSPPMELLFQLKTCNLFKISQLYKDIKYQRNNPAYTTLSKLLTTLRFKWKITAPKIIQLLKNLFEFSEAFQSFGHMMKVASLEKMVQSCQNAISTYHQDLKVCNKYMKQMTDISTELEEAIEYAEERIHQKINRAKEKYETLEKEFVTAKFSTLKSMGIQKQFDDHEDMINVQFRNLVRSKNLLKNCKKSSSVLKLNRLKLSKVEELLNSLDKTYQKMEKNIGILKRIPDKLFIYSEFRFIGHLVAEKWKIIEDEVGFVIHALVFGDRKFVQPHYRIELGKGKSGFKFMITPRSEPVPKKKSKTETLKTGPPTLSRREEKAELPELDDFNVDDFLEENDIQVDDIDDVLAELGIDNDDLDNQSLETTESLDLSFLKE